MKKVITLLGLTLLSNLAFADTCPRLEEMLKGDHLTPPAGWHFGGGWSHPVGNPYEVRFGIAAYGADLHEPTAMDFRVRCNYYSSGSSRFSVESDQVIDISRIKNNPHWLRTPGTRYFICTDYVHRDVENCPF